MKIRSNWVCLSQAVDQDGNTVDLQVSTRHYVIVAKAFVCKAINVQGGPPRTLHAMAVVQLARGGDSLRERW